MSMTTDENIKRWTAKRKTALVIEIIQGKTTVAEASRSFDLSPSEIEGWVEDAKRGMENSLRANPLDIREHQSIWAAPSGAPSRQHPSDAPTGQWMERIPPPEPRREEDALREPKVREAKLLGQRLMPRDFDRQVAELQTRIAALNGYTSLGIPVTEPVS